MNDQDLLRRRILYMGALRALSREDPRWDSNCNIYMRWNDKMRDWWIDRIESKGHGGLPMAEVLIAKVIQLRMTT